MMPALVAVSLCGVLIALPDAQAQASETCVKEARAALEVDAPTAFGPEAIVEGPKIIATVEREELPTSRSVLSVLRRLLVTNTQSGSTSSASSAPAIASCSFALTHTHGRTPLGARDTSW